jgi:hypothetical protein
VTDLPQDEAQITEFSCRLFSFTPSAVLFSFTPSALWI